MLFRSAVSAVQSGTPVPFESLQALLPTVPGWTRGEMTGMVLSVPMRGTQASLTLSRGDARMSIEIIDTVFNQTLYAPVVAYLTEGFQTTTDDGTKRAAKVQDQPALEEFTQDSQTAALTVLVGKRFLVPRQLRQNGLAEAGVEDYSHEQLLYEYRVSTLTLLLGGLVRAVKFVTPKAHKRMLQDPKQGDLMRLGDIARERTAARALHWRRTPQLRQQFFSM